MKHIIRLLKSLLAFLVVFGALYVADPAMATFQGFDPHNTHAHANPGLYRLVTYVIYIVPAWVVWLVSDPDKDRSPYPPLMP